MIKKLLKKVKGFIHNRRVLLVAFCLLIVLIIVIIRIIIGSSCTMNCTFFDMTVFFTIIVETIIIAVVDWICKLISKNHEDSMKLTTDYEGLLENYCNDDGNNQICRQEIGKPIIFQANDKSINTFPVILETWLYEKEIKVLDDPNSHYTPPQLALMYYDRLLSAHGGSTIYNSIKIRVDSWGMNGTVFTIHTGRTTYFDSLVTNRAMDYCIEKNLSIRKLYEFGSEITPLEKSVLSNHLGINGFIVDKDNNILFVKRKNDLSVGKRLWGASVSGSVKISRNGDVFSEKELFESILLEIKAETGISKHDLVDLKGSEKVVILAAYRDMVEGGKPHLVFYAKCKLSKSEIKDRFDSLIFNRAAKCDNDETLYKKKELQTQTDAKKICLFSRCKVENMELSCNKLKVKCKKRRKSFKTIPSYAACVWILREYWKRTEG